jgi:hypothetical protein
MSNLISSSNGRAYIQGLRSAKENIGTNGRKSNTMMDKMT